MITFSFDIETNIRTATYSGSISDGELIASYQALLTRPDYNPTAKDLVDLRLVDRFNVSSEALRNLISMYNPKDRLGHRPRLAIISASDFTYGMSRIYEMLRGDEVSEEIHIFRNYDDAVLWLQS
ncbi:MAG: hypothetical protein WDA22_15945 [Bacteroidota bacterium]